MEDGSVMINILYEDNHLLVVEKPCNMPTQQDESNDLDLLTRLKEDLKIRYNKPGDVYLGLVHRLDRPVGGIMVFAKTSKAASRLSDQIRTHQFQKTYYAVVNFNDLKQQDTWIDMLKKDHKTNTSKVTSRHDPQGKEAILSYSILGIHQNLAQVEISLKTGRSHQIRVQFSSRNHALWGDQRYNRFAQANQQIALWAYSIRFIHPTTKQPLKFQINPPDKIPWNYFR